MYSSYLTENAMILNYKGNRLMLCGKIFALYLKNHTELIQNL